MTTKFNLRSNIAAIAAAFLFSSACVLSAVGPIETGALAQTHAAERATA